jgi:glutathione S-transferase
VSAILYVGNRNYSSWSLRGSLIVRQSGIPCDEVVIPLDLPGTRERIAAVSPSGRVPVLHHHGRVVWDTLAIAELLHEERPDAGLWPRDAAQRAFARSVSAEMHSSFTALRDAMPMDVRAENLQVERTAEIEADIERIVAIWGDCRQRHGAAGPYLFGAWSVADAMYAPVVSRFRTYGVELDGAARDYADAIWAWPALATLAAEASREPWSLDTGV